MVKKRHSLVRLHQLYARNYLRLSSLVPAEVAEGARWHLHLSSSIELGLKLVEQTKYTQIIEIQRWLPATNWLQIPSISVRLYHDARMAEVLSGQQISQLLPVYDWQTAQSVFAKDRYQANLFLAEILECLAPKRLQSLMAAVKE